MATKAAIAQPIGGASLPIPEALPADGFVRWSVLKAFVPFSRETLRKRELEGRFPQRRHLSQRCAAWSCRELHEWFSDPVGYRAPESA